MGMSNLNATLCSFQLFVLSIVIFSTISRSQQVFSNPLQEAACGLINCGQGTCVASNASLLGFDCACNQGWQKMPVGPLTFPSCVVPNCTVNFQCGSGEAPPPPPPPPAPTNLPPFNPLNPCVIVWCGHGTCVVNGTGYYCQCHEGSSNLLDATGLACFKQGYFGADCHGIGFGPQQSPPSSPNTSGSSGGGGPNDVSKNCSRILNALLSLLSVTAIFFLLWI